MDESRELVYSERGVHDASLLREDLSKEYFALVELVSSFDQRLLTIKGWGVTLSLASLGLGFQQGHYGLFLVAAVSGLAFWIVEGTTKFHQKRHYPRMADIELAMFDLYGVATPRWTVSSPLIRWGWYTADRRLRGGRDKGDPRIPQPWADVVHVGSHPILYPHVMFPHLVSVVVGAVLFAIGLFGVFGPI